jgi:exodeoxyribonuclease VII large subunit
MPRIVGVATSPTGAALADFLKVSRQRFPAAKILLSPCTVQGAHAAGSVVAAVDLLLEDGRAEVIVLTRGGGSAQDLLAFQDEHLARYVANCPVPTVSAVGHEVDTTLCDLVADRVAPTPSAAAMAVLPDARVLAQRVDEAMTTLDAHLRRGLRRRRERLVHLRKRLRHPGERLAEVRRRLVTAQTRLETAMAAQVRRRRERLAALTPRLDGFARSLPARRARVDALQTRLHTAMARQLEQRRARVTGALQRAEALSPAGVLQRGYALVTGPQGLVDRVDRATTGDALTVRVSDGQLTVRVESTSAG